MVSGSEKGSGDQQNGKTHGKSGSRSVEELRSFAGAEIEIIMFRS